MKRMSILITFCFLLSDSSLFAQESPSLKVKIPFQFTVASQTLPAGEYLISTVQPERTIRIAGAGGTISFVQTVSPTYSIRPSTSSRLVFREFGDSYFLEQIWSLGSDAGRTIPQGKREIEMAQAGMKPQIVSLAGASSGR
jgi:hypothetical protein